MIRLSPETVDLANLFRPIIIIIIYFVKTAVVDNINIMVIQKSK